MLVSFFQKSSSFFCEKQLPILKQLKVKKKLCDKNDLYKKKAVIQTALHNKYYLL